MGTAPDFNCTELRSFFLQNALYWLEAYRFDGLRIDAADHLAGGDGDVDFLIEMEGHVKWTITSRRVHIVTEDARNAASPMTPSSDGLVGVDAEWNDDFHHVIHVATTHEDGGIYEDFANQPYTVFAARSQPALSIKATRGLLIILPEAVNPAAISRPTGS